MSRRSLVDRHGTGAESLLPLLDREDHHLPSVFRPENMLREARRQKGLPSGSVPPICLLDPDGDMVAFVRAQRCARPSPHWACYHTTMWEWSEQGLRFGIVGSAVGGSFAVLVAEQMFASGCGMVISIASAGQIASDLARPCHVLITRALRDEGTSQHYLPPAAFVEADPVLVGCAAEALQAACLPVVTGASWTTDAPFRETEAAIERRRGDGLLVVEMEAASLYAFGQACGRPVLCLAHVTNELGRNEGDFEKGLHNGATLSLTLAVAMAQAWRRAR